MAAEDGDAGYVGSEVCITCHESQQEGFTEHFNKTIHAKVLNDTNALTPLMKKGCEACHGPGGEHVAAGGGKGVGGLQNFAGRGPDEVRAQNQVCLTCHRGGKRVYWHGSTHQTRDVGCVSCHTLMRKVSDRYQLARHDTTATCGSCHLIQKAREFRRAHMPVREGKMDCASCHNPHGTVTASLIAANTVNEKCYSCHADKRGPFLWEHAPVPENCLTCHDPHGTTRANMLKLGVPRLCQTCHIPTRHPTDPRAPDERFVLAKGCLNCHPQIHGSNHPSGNRFTR